ncbi:MAG: SUMF1/EgtB/PvdO family nonheme iron enzyme [Minicystis sp.]
MATLRAIRLGSPAIGILFTLGALAGCGGGGDDTTGSATSSTGTGGHHGTGGSGGSGGHGGSTGGAGGTGSATASSSTGGGMGGEGGSMMPSPCPPDMAVVGMTCMDFYEAPNQKGADPLVMQSAVDAENWCEAKGKRLCTEDEWDTACAGPEDYVYPYGDTHVASQCNDDKTWKTVNESALNTWPSQTAKDEVDKLWQGAPSGSYEGCVSGYGVYDLTGNIEEWVVRTQPHVNSYPHVLKGCYWAGCYGGASPRCASTNPAHADGFRYYETGFRCCKDAAF